MNETASVFVSPADGCALGCFLFWLGSHLLRKGESLAAQCDRYDEILTAFRRDINESAACCASIVHLLGEGARCECFRCRRQRGEDVTEESQAQAEAIQERAAKRFAEMVNACKGTSAHVDAQIQRIQTPAVPAPVTVKLRTGTSTTKSQSQRRMQ